MYEIITSDGASEIGGGDDSEDRPTMSSVVLMLGNENALPLPKQPAFFAEEEMPEHRSISSGPTSVSVNDITIKLLDGR
ncbi:G-type lectin S-receptor-like serine/threonine-protein kinase isoform X2 [Tanacetum coccineum]|uniref:G-type lectin S-receptor-like serine/threonine-protein kinase isoform X2 n=1 Tax=Tanacetum coccineum TaxID=301880 RepID=A0ABQ4Z0V7_9ASTR